MNTTRCRLFLKRLASVTCGDARQTYTRTRAGCRPALAAASGLKFAPVKLLKLHRALHDALSDHRSVDPNKKTQHTELGESRACVASVKVVATSDERRSAAAGCRRGRGLPPPCRRRRAVAAPPPPARACAAAPTPRRAAERDTSDIRYTSGDSDRRTT